MLDANIVAGCVRRFAVVVEHNFDMQVPAVVVPSSVPVACSLGASGGRLAALEDEIVEVEGVAG